MAESVSGAPLGRLCLEGPMEELTQAHNLQPALTAINLICYQMVKEAGIKADFLAGHSLGEYSALCASGVLSPEDTMKLVTERGRLMGRAGQENPGGMRAVLGLNLQQVNDVLSKVEMADKISVGNHNSEKQVVISGAAEALDKASELASAAGGKVIPLNVAVANHSPLMAKAVPEFEKLMAGITFNQPTTPVYFNVTANPETEPDAIRAMMAAQIKSTVCWLDIINKLVDQGVMTFIEVGPKAVLSGLMKKILPRKAGHQCFQVDTPEKLAKCVAALM